MIAEILDAVGIPYPNADVDKTREAADLWNQLADAIGDAAATASGQAEALIEGNRGPAISRFEEEWNHLEGGSKGLTELGETCRSVAQGCSDYADAVEHARHKLEEELAGGGVALGGAVFFTAVTLGGSDAAGSALGDAIVDACGADVEVLDVSIQQIISRMISAGAVNLLTSLASSAASDTVAQLTGEKTMPTSEELLKAFNSGLAGAAAGTIAPLAGSGIARLAESEKTWDLLPGDIDKVLPQLPTALAATPGAVESQAGQSIISILSQDAVGQVDSAGQPSPVASSGMCSARALRRR